MHAELSVSGLDIPLLGLVIGHSYLHFINLSAGIDEVLEGYQSSSGTTLLAQVTPNGLPADNKATDSSAGGVSGAFVRSWLPPLLTAVSTVNNANITYWYTSNRHSVTRYMLTQTPTTFTPWWTYPSSFIGGLVGFYTLLPGVEN